MKFSIKHEMKGRIRVHLHQNRMSFEQADTLLYYLTNNQYVTNVKVFERTADAAIYFVGDRENIIEALRKFAYENVDVPAAVLETSGRGLNNTYQRKMVEKVVYRYARRILLPYPVRAVYTTAMSLKYIYKGVKTLLKGKIEVPVLDATAIGVSVIRNDIATADSIMFLLGIGELLEEWTHKKSVDDLARTMSLNTGSVWMLSEGKEVQVSSNDIKEGDCVVVHMGTIIPFDGEVYDGEAMVNQASITGESMPVRRVKDNYVYAGTVVEEGEITIKVKKVGGTSQYEKIVGMIEETEKLKSASESKASHIADKLVPYTLGGTALTYLLTRNVTKALSVLMVDFSCALKLAMPITVLSAIREASLHNVTVKGGKFLEAVSEADTIVFDKTGTLTKAKPTVVDVVSFCDETPDELLRIAACLEEHFPHSMAKAVVEAAKQKSLEHEEMHSKVDYVVAHGISSYIDNRKAVIGSYHFVFEDEGVEMTQEIKDLISSLESKGSSSLIYLAIAKKLAGIISIYDPLKPEAKEVVQELRDIGFDKVIMLTGDSPNCAKAIAKQLNLDDFRAGVLPEDKASYIESLKKEGNTVVMVGDGINDTPALSMADVSISLQDSSDIARELADITLVSNSLNDIVALRMISEGLFKRIHSQYRLIVGLNTSFIVLGALGLLTPQMLAMLHNGSTFLIASGSTRSLLH